MTYASLGRTCTVLPPVSLWFRNGGSFPTTERVLPTVESGQVVRAALVVRALYAQIAIRTFESSVRIAVRSSVNCSWESMLEGSNPSG